MAVVVIALAAGVLVWSAPVDWHQAARNIFRK